MVTLTFNTVTDENAIETIIRGINQKVTELIKIMLEHTRLLVIGIVFSAIYLAFVRPYKGEEIYTWCCQWCYLKYSSHNKH